jgi:hypothetical protein
MAKVTYAKHEGDDPYSYAVFVDGKVVPGLSGLNRDQAKYYRDQVIARIKEFTK